MFQKVFDIREGHGVISKHRYGMIVAEKGQISFVQMRPFPKLISMMEALWVGGFAHKRIRRDRVQVFYNHPMSHDKFLAATYAVSDLGTTLATIRAARNCMDEIARLKGCDAALCEVTNKRVSERVLSYWGWQPHNPNRNGRHYIRRYYGEYPAHQLDLGI